jgi:hypothetical protein
MFQGANKTNSSPAYPTAFASAFGTRPPRHSKVRLLGIAEQATPRAPPEPNPPLARLCASHAANAGASPEWRVQDGIGGQGFSGVSPDPVGYVSSSTNSVGIYKGVSYPPYVTLIAMEYPLAEEPPGTPSPHSTIIQQSCKMLWGNSGDPTVSTAEGQQLFTNTLNYALGLFCPWEVYISLVNK